MLSQTFAPPLNGRKLAVGEVLINVAWDRGQTYTVEGFDANSAVLLRSRKTGQSDWCSAFGLPRWFYRAATAQAILATGGAA